MNVPRDIVHAVMYDIDPEGLAARGVDAKKRKPRGHFTTKGPNFVHSVDNSTWIDYPTPVLRRDGRYNAS